MKIANFAGRLRLLFQILRVLVGLSIVLYAIVLFLIPLIVGGRLDAEGGMKIFGYTVGSVALPLSPAPVANLDVDETALVELGEIRGELHLNSMSDDSALFWIVRSNMFYLFLKMVFSLALIEALRRICARVEQGELFSEGNLRRIRNIGFILIGFNLGLAIVSVAVQMVTSRYLQAHLSINGVGLEGTDALWKFRMAEGFPDFGGLVTGLLVLLIAEAFRQGLALKAENDLTV